MTSRSSRRNNNAENLQNVIPLVKLVCVAANFRCSFPTPVEADIFSTFSERVRRHSIQRSDLSSLVPSFRGQPRPHPQTVDWSPVSTIKRRRFSCSLKYRILYIGLLYYYIITYKEHF